MNRWSVGDELARHASVALTRHCHGDFSAKVKEVLPTKTAIADAMGRRFVQKKERFVRAELACVRRRQP